MQITVTGRHMTPTESTRAYAEEKFGRIAKIYDAEDMVAEVVLEAQKNRSNPERFIAEVTVHLKGHVVRAEESASDMLQAIDLASDKAEKQMRKYKDRVVDRRRRGGTVVKTAPGDTDLSAEPEDIAEPLVSRTKTIDLKPMSAEEAALQMDLLGHDFFVFRAEETDQVNVLYRRTGGDYGLICPRV
jgi:putative sigma-54 modulation protein